MPETVDDIAAGWAIRIDARPLTPDEEVELGEWLALSERHRGALLRAEAMLSYVDRTRALASGVALGGGEPADRPLLGRRSLLAAAASGALAATFAGFAVVQSWQQTIDTKVGEIRRVPLDDGSIAAVNTQSRLHVDLGKTRRLVRLAEGEAWFQVAHDASKPFIVEAGDVRVEAVGTAFSVRRRENGADVLVTEGRVKAWNAAEPDRPVLVDAGFRTFVGSGLAARPVQAEAEIERALAWRNGEIALDGETLGQAVEEFNRYNRKKLVVGDPRLADETLVGYFKTSEPETFARAVGQTVGAIVTEDQDRILISSGR